MKRFKRTKGISFAALAVSTALLCGCENAAMPFAEKLAYQEKNCTMNAEISCGELSAQAKVTRLAKGEWEFAFTEPKELMGVAVKLSDEGVTASLGALSVTAEPSSVYNMLPQIIARAVDALPDTPADKITEADGVLTLENECADGKVVVMAKKSTGDLISLKCPYQRLAVHFTEITDEVCETADTEEVRLVE